MQTVLVTSPRSWLLIGDDATVLSGFAVKAELRITIRKSPLSVPVYSSIPYPDSHTQIAPLIGHWLSINLIHPKIGWPYIAMKIAIHTCTNFDTYDIRRQEQFLDMRSAHFHLKCPGELGGRCQLGAVLPRNYVWKLRDCYPDNG